MEFAPSASRLPALSIDPVPLTETAPVLPWFAAIAVVPPWRTLTEAPFVMLRVPLPLLPTMMFWMLVSDDPLPSTETLPMAPD